MKPLQILLLCIFSAYLTKELQSEEPPRPKTYCNPIAIPNYPIGRFVRDLDRGDTGPDWMWRLGYKQQFRELADVTALWFDGKFYLYPSVDMAWVSDDLGATWKHHPLNVRDIGYAPTIVKHKGRFLLMASNSPIYTSSSLDCARMADRHHTLCCRVYCVWQHALVTSASTRLSQAVYRKSYRDNVVGVIARSGSSGAGDSQPTDLAVSVRFQLKS